MMISNKWLNNIHPEWQDIVERALSTMDAQYLIDLAEDQQWLPGQDKLFAAFSQPLITTRYILFGESPYPRVESANGYAFWDARVDQLWSKTGLSKAVNKATSLRNLIKMLLYARGDLVEDQSQSSIATLDHSNYVQTANELFLAMIQHGFLLLNATLVFSEKRVTYHARHWQPFMLSVLNQLLLIKPEIMLILFGRVAANIPNFRKFSYVMAEHPYNLSFITNPVVTNFFKPMDLIYEHEKQH